MDLVWLIELVHSVDWNWPALFLGAYVLVGVIFLVLSPSADCAGGVILCFAFIFPGAAFCIPLAFHVYTRFIWTWIPCAWQCVFGCCERFEYCTGQFEVPHFHKRIC